MIGPITFVLLTRSDVRVRKYFTTENGKQYKVIASQKGPDDDDTLRHNGVDDCRLA